MSGSTLPSGWMILRAVYLISFIINTADSFGFQKACESKLNRAILSCPSLGFNDAAKKIYTPQSSFSSLAARHPTVLRVMKRLNEEEIAKLKAEAKELLKFTEEYIEKEKAKNGDGPVIVTTNSLQSQGTPSVASSAKNYNDAKSRDETSGEVTTDDESIEDFSELEESTYRSIGEKFFMDEKILSPEEQAREERMERLAKKDIGAGMYNLRKSLQNEDFKYIFDSSNFYIGEE